MNEQVQRLVNEDVVRESSRHIEWNRHRIKDSPSLKPDFTAVCFRGLHKFLE